MPHGHPWQTGPQSCYGSGPFLLHNVWLRTLSCLDRGEPGLARASLHELCGPVQFPLWFRYLLRLLYCRRFVGDGQQGICLLTARPRMARYHADVHLSGSFAAACRNPGLVTRLKSSSPGVQHVDRMGAWQRAFIRSLSDKDATAIRPGRPPARCRGIGSGRPEAGHPADRRCVGCTRHGRNIQAAPGTSNRQRTMVVRHARQRTGKTLRQRGVAGRKT